jgi:hypothetical protein
VRKQFLWDFVEGGAVRLDSSASQLRAQKTENEIVIDLGKDALCAIGTSRKMDDWYPARRLKNYPLAMVRFACDTRGRRGQYRKERLIAEYGDDVVLPGAYLSAKICPTSQSECLLHPRREDSGSKRCGRTTSSIGQVVLTCV